MNLEDMTNSIFKASAVAGTAYLAANSTPLASLGALMFGAYAISHEPLQEHLESKLESYLEDCREDKKEDAKKIIHNAKGDLAKIRYSFQMMAIVCGLIDTHLAMASDDTSKFIAATAVTLGYCGMCLKSMKYAERLKAKE